MEYEDDSPFKNLLKSKAKIFESVNRFLHEPFFQSTDDNDDIHIGEPSEAELELFRQYKQLQTNDENEFMDKNAVCDETFDQSTINKGEDSFLVLREEVEEFVASLLAKIELDHQCENLELSLLETRCKDVAETELSIMDSKHDKSECGIDVFNICHAQIDASPLVEESSLEVIEPYNLLDMSLASFENKFMAIYTTNENSIKSQKENNQEIIVMKNDIEEKMENQNIDILEQVENLMDEEIPVNLFNISPEEKKINKSETKFELKQEPKTKINSKSAAKRPVPFVQGSTGKKQSTIKQSRLLIPPTDFGNLRSPLSQSRLQNSIPLKISYNSKSKNNGELCHSKLITPTNYSDSASKIPRSTIKSNIPVKMGIENQANSITSISKIGSQRKLKPKSLIPKSIQYNEKKIIGSRLPTLKR